MRVAGNPRASVARTVTRALTAAVGVPEIVPPAPRVSPAGNVPAATDQVNGAVPPVAVSVAE